MAFIKLIDAVEKYPFVFSSYGAARVMLSKNTNNIREITLKVGHNTFFDEDVLIEWIKKQTYKKRYYDMSKK